MPVVQDPERKDSPRMEPPLGCCLQDLEGKEKAGQAPQVWGSLLSLTLGIKRPLINIGCLKSRVDGKVAQPWTTVEGICALEMDSWGSNPSPARSWMGDFVS